MGNIKRQKQSTECACTHTSTLYLLLHMTYVWRFYMVTSMLRERWGQETFLLFDPSFRCAVVRTGENPRALNVIFCFSLTHRRWCLPPSFHFQGWFCLSAYPYLDALIPRRENPTDPVSGPINAGTITDHNDGCSSPSVLSHH